MTTKAENCPVDETLSSLLAGELGEHATLTIESHLDTCVSCLNRVQNSLKGTDDEWASWQKLIDESSLDDFTYLSSANWPDRAGRLLAQGDSWKAILSAPDDTGELGRINQYSIYKEVGRGGMGIVLQGRDRDLDRLVAVKIMHPEFAASDEHRQRFIREARAAAAIEHPHVVPIHQVGEHNGYPFLVMKYLNGESLAARSQSCRLEFSEVKRIGHEIALGLDAIHNAGQIHRDIKPANIWLEAPGSRVRILDFGLTRPDSGADLTEHGTVMGTPAYMSPEQARGESVDVRADLFSVGTVLYQAASGQSPFPGETSFAILSSLATHTPKRLKEVAPEMDPTFCDLVMRLLSRNPADRPGSAAEVAKELSISFADTARLGGTQTLSHKIPDRTDANSPPDRTNFWRQLKTWAFGTGLVALAAIIFRLSTPEGELIVELADGIAPEEISIRAERNGDVDIIDASNSWTINVKSGKYHVTLNGGDDRFKLDRDKVTVSRNGKGRLRVLIRRPGSPQPEQFSPDSADRSVAEWVLSTGGSVFLGNHRAVLTTRINKIEDLPDTPFTIHGINLHDFESVKDEDALRLGELQDLTNIYFGSDNIDRRCTDGILKSLADAKPPRLLSVFLNRMDLTSDGIAQLRSLDSVTMLKLHDVRLQDHAWEEIAGIPQLRNLSLSTMSIQPGKLAALSDIPLKTLYLVSIPTCDDSFMTQLPSWKSLTFISVRECPVTDEGLMKIARYSTLQTLYLLDLPTITEDSWRLLGKLPELRNLKIDGCTSSITPTALESITDVNSLEHLSLRGTVLGDEVLGKLDSLTGLKSLILQNDPPFSELVVEELRKSLPDCNISVSASTSE